MSRTSKLGSSLAFTALLGSALAVTTVGSAVAGPGDLACAAQDEAQTFTMDYIDTSRAGGEPIVTRHPDGQLLWGSHAGTTHFYSPESPSAASAAFVQNYEGQTYYYVSDDTESWDFVPRTPVAAVAPVVGVPATGFSDPEFAISPDGTGYISEINLANVAVSKSVDGGHTYNLVNVFSFTSSDRQWMAADRRDDLYMTANGFGGGSFPAGAIGNVGHFMAKSTDGGLTWGAPSKTNSDGIGDIQIDHARGIMYELSPSGDGNTLSMTRFANIRNEDTNFAAEKFTIDTGMALSGVQRLIGPTFDMDADGNLYAVWEHNGSDTREPGIYYAYSTDQAETWSTPQQVDTTDNDDVWPWIAVGDAGNVAVTWLQSSETTDAKLGGEAGGSDAQWDVMVAATDTGLGCAEGALAGFNVATASSEPIHTGTICQHGTTCQADLTDRRLGDYHTVEVDGNGMVHVAVSDTREGGAISLPLHIRQTGGPTLGTPDSAPEQAAGAGTAVLGASQDDAGAVQAASDAAGRQLANTGGGAGIAAFGLLTMLAARRRRD
jgi:hypothetical protein